MLCCRKTKGVCQDKSTKCVPQEPGVAKQQVRVQRLDPTTRLRHCSLGKPTLGSCCASRLVARDADEPVILDASMYQGATVAVSHQHCLRVPVNTAGCATERRPGCGHGAQTKGCQTQWSAWRGGGGRVALGLWDLPRLKPEVAWSVDIGTSVAPRVRRCGWSLTSTCLHVPTNTITMTTLTCHRTKRATQCNEWTCNDSRWCCSDTGMSGYNMPKRSNDDWAPNSARQRSVRAP